MNIDYEIKLLNYVKEFDTIARGDWFINNLIKCKKGEGLDNLKELSIDHLCIILRKYLINNMKYDIISIINKDTDINICFGTIFKKWLQFQGVSD